MIKIYTKKETLTDAERIRLEEIMFYNFIMYLFKTNSNPAKVYGFVEVICTLGNCDLLIINNVVSMCMSQDYRYVPRQQEHIYLLTKSSTPVRKVTAQFSISQRDYYKIKNSDPPDIQPKFSPKQYIEIIKFMDCLTKLIPERIR